MTMPAILALMESGAEWEDPSEDLLLELLRDVGRGYEQSLTLERLDEIGNSKVRFRRAAERGWVAEVDGRDGGTRVLKSWTDLRAVHVWLVCWAFHRDHDGAR